MERSIGATDLRQRLTDVLQAVRERGETYIVETFGRPQVAIINLDECRRIQRFRREREAFFEWLEAAAARNAESNVGLSDEEVLAIEFWLGDGFSPDGRRCNQGALIP